MPTVTFANLPRAVANEIARRLERSRLGEVLLDQALERIDQAGDSEHRYPELWATKRGIGYRQGGEPLQDTGRLKQSLHTETIATGDGIRVSLRSGVSYAELHQHGGKTKGPNFIPLTLKARRTHRTGVDPKTEGLIEGEDYVMAWGGVTVPQRKIFNLPPENVRDIKRSIVRAIEGDS